MKKTSEEFMEWLGLKVGDKVVCLDSRYIFEVIFLWKFSPLEVNEHHEI